MKGAVILLNVDPTYLSLQYWNQKFTSFIIYDLFESFDLFPYLRTENWASEVINFQDMYFFNLIVFSKNKSLKYEKFIQMIFLGYQL